MERNYDKPYRGLPAEIRLQIWKLMIPNKAAIAAKELKEDWPSLQPQLLRLNRQIHSEVLSFFRNVEVYLHPDFGNEKTWQQIVQALRSPISDNLTVAWEQSYVGFAPPPLRIGNLFFILLFMDLPHPLHRITISFSEPCFWDGSANQNGFKHYVREPELLAILAAAYLKRNLTTEVRLKVHNIPEILVPRFSVEYLSNCLAGTEQADAGIVTPWSDYLTFRQHVVEKIGSDLDQNVRITAEFFKESKDVLKPVGVFTFKLGVD